MSKMPEAPQDPQDPQMITDRIQKAYAGETMNDPIETTATEAAPDLPSLNMPIAGILPIEAAEQNIGFVLMADGTVRWVELPEKETEVVKTGEFSD